MWSVKHLFLLLFLLPWLNARAQFVDDFSDGDFTSNPEWFGQTDRFIIDNGRLRLNAPAVAATSYLVTNSEAIENAVWEFFVRLDFNPSSTNLARVYLVSNNAVLTQPLNGYFVRIGGTEDEVSLFKQTGSTITKIIDGEDKRIDFNLVEVKIKVTRDEEGNWELFSDVGASGNYVQEGSSVKDETHLISNYFGVSCIYTQTRSMHFYFDDFEVSGIPVSDKFPPEVLSTEIVNENTIRIFFNEELDEQSATTVTNYTLNEGMGTAQSVTLEENNTQTLVQFAQAFPNGKLLTLTINGVEDLSDNAMSNYQTTFRYFVPEPAEWKDIIISEFFPDPDPPVGLPNQEFVEIYNRSNKVFNLLNWKLIDPGATGTLRELYFFPGDYLIIATNSGAPLYNAFGQTMGITGMPTLNNNGDILELRDADGKLIDSLSYDLTWYQDNSKRNGGWTIEIIDPDNFCTDKENYRSSVDERGGSPGTQNSVYQFIEDNHGPRLTHIDIEENILLDLHFDEKLHPNSLFGNFMLNPLLDIEERSFASGDRTSLHLRLSGELQIGTNYHITIADVSDCKANFIEPEYGSFNILIEAEAPFVKEIVVADENHLQIIFSEVLEISSAENKSNYQVTEIGAPTTVRLMGEGNYVELFFLTSFVNGKTYQINIQSVFGLYNNEIAPTEKAFMYFRPIKANAFDIVVSEIFPDPTPPVGLPEYEFVEIYNRSEHPFDLSGWRLIDPGANGSIPAYLIQPGEHVILASAAARPHYQSFGKILTVSNMPILNNSSDQLWLVSPEGLTIDSISYQLSWYKDNDKRDGGWTLERIDPDDLCREELNWTASVDPKGGTPGKVNSVNEFRPDLTGPQLLQAIALDEEMLLLRFNEKISDESLKSIKITLSDNLNADEVFFQDQGKTALIIRISPRLIPSKVYQVKIEDVYDCPGNVIQDAFKDKSFVLTEAAEVGDVAINEILFNPRPGGVDFVEIYNSSNKYFNLKGWRIGNYANGESINSRSITMTDELFPPGSFKILTPNINILKGDYPQTKEEHAFVLTLPSYPDREGSVSLLNNEGHVIDYFEYHENMHSTLLRSREGVSLERISHEHPGQVNSNWKSASSVAGFATPGYVNSASRTQHNLDEYTIKVEPEVFMPRYGIEDFTRIQYAFDQAGLSANVFVIDQQGRKVKTLANNELLSVDGFFTWDGSDDNGAKVKTGSYMLYFQVFNASGFQQVFRKRVVVATKF